MDTHIHADHLSRSRQFAERSGARITRLNEACLFSEGDVTELEAGANRYAIS